MKYYVAFSIHGTNAFITASGEFAPDYVAGSTSEESVIIIKGETFTVAQSRRPDYNIRTDGIKLNCSKLMTKRGQPLKCPLRVLRFFNALADNGWTVDKSAFIRRHSYRFNTVRARQPKN